MPRILPLLFTALIHSGIHGQVATSYSFTQTSGTYTAITGGTQLYGGILQLDNFDDQVSAAQTIPAFNFAGTVYTQMYVSINGYITFGSAPSGTNYTPISSTAAYGGAIAAFGADLQNTNAGFGLTQREVRWQTVGSEVVIQWKGVRRKGVSNENFNFQIRLNTSTNSISMVYGSLAGLGNSTAQQPQVGLRGPDNTFATNVNNRTVGTGAENWASSLAGTAATSAMRFTNSAPAKSFTNGLTYTWAPNCTLPAATVSTSANCPAGTYTATVNVTSLGSAASVNLVSSVSGTFATNVGLGSYAAPAVPLGTTQTITVAHGSAALCDLTLSGIVLSGSCITNGTCLGTPLSIPDNGCGSTFAFGFIPISTTGTTLNSDVFLNSVELVVSHTFLSDVRIRLISPTGQGRNLVLNRFDTGANLGDPAQCPNAVFRLKDDGAALVNTAASNVTGDWAPEATLAGFTGNPNGTWTIRLCDNALLDAGTLNYVKLNFAPCQPAAATVSTTPNYVNGTMTATVNVTSVGSGGTVDIESSSLGLEHDNVGIGSYTVGPYPICDPITLTLRHGTNAVCDVALQVTPPGTCVTPATCLSPAPAIPDNGCASNNKLVALINVTAPGTNLNTDVLLDHVDLVVAHTFNADLEITLTSPSGQTRNLVLDRFGGGNNLGNPANCPTAVLRLKDGGTALTNTATSNVTGTRAPEQTLVGFTGDPNGVWRLTICDDAAVDAGTLRYAKLGFLAMGSTDACAPRSIGCFEMVEVNSTQGAPTWLPASACAFNGAPSTGGVHWWTYTATSNDDIRFQVINPGHDVRLSAFKATGAPACSTLVCVGGVDNTPGFGNGGELKVKASTGDVIYLAVHGTANGPYTLSTDCQPAACAQPANDLCAGATNMSLGFNPVTLTDDLTCAYVDGPTTASGTSPVQGLWYTFNSGVNSILPMYLGTPGTAVGLRYTLFTGGCNGLGGATEAGNGLAAQVNHSVTPGTQYHMLVYNTGGVGIEGSYTLSMEAPPLNDAAITQVVSPTGLVCGTQYQPVVRLKNLGENTLTSVVIQANIDGGPTVVTHTWTGSLAFQAETLVQLPVINTPSGNHQLNVWTLLAGDQRATNDNASSNYNADGQEVRVRMTTDANPGELTWILYNSSFVPVETSLPYLIANSTVTTTHCLPAGGRYYFTMSDAGSDGINSGGAGAWELRDALNRIVLQDNGAFMSVSPTNPSATAGYSSHEVHLPLGPSRPWTTAPYNVCGNMNHGVLSKVRCTTAAGAAQYQFEFSDPNRGYRRRVTSTTNFVTWTSMGGQAPQLGVRYFVRVRADQGAPGFNDNNWGEGCEMGWANTNSAFCTGLITTPGNTFSCGASRTWGGTSKIWAEPVPGAVPYDANADGDVLDAGDQQYAYHFRITGTGALSGYQKDAYSTNYILPLNWSTLPMSTPGVYNVQVQVQVGGAWRGFCGNTCQVTIVPSGPVQGGNDRMTTTTGASSTLELSVWPNPSTDGRFNVSFHGTTSDDEVIELEVRDASGRMIQQQRIAAGALRTAVTMELGADASAGMYTVIARSTQGTMTKRLSVL
ncbi:MAG: proprotein convertase P-domain-containing protein [Flavobacteriales bacterium]|nr:proprotein convertase P-domain-containing protein [Flavobacteriales bacterium]